jgi:nucleoside-diphosphate-sugar epimerase
MRGKVRAVVTGGAGFVGSHLCELLLYEDIEVVCVDNLLTGAEENIVAARQDPHFTFVRQDVTEALDFPADMVFHCASPASPVDYALYPIKTMLANSVGTMNCLELAVREGARMVMCSTSEVYGDPEVSPQQEGYFGNVNPVGPRSCYDESKRFAEAMCKAYEREREAQVVIIRIFNTYGPRMREHDGRVIPNFVCQALDDRPLTVYGDGSQTRSFCNVADLVRGLYFAMTKEGATGNVINLGNPAEMTVLELARKVIESTGSSSPVEFEPLPQDDPRRRRPDISRAAELLGWSPTVGLDEGLAGVVSYFKEKR